MTIFIRKGIPKRTQDYGFLIAVWSYESLHTQGNVKQTHRREIIRFADCIYSTTKQRSGPWT